MGVATRVAKVHRLAVQVASETLSCGSGRLGGIRFGHALRTVRPRLSFKPSASRFGCFGWRAARRARAPLLFGTKVVRPLAKLRIGAARARLVLCHTAFIDGSIPILGRRTALHGSRFQPRTDAVPLRQPSSIVAFRRV